MVGADDDEVVVVVACGGAAAGVWWCKAFEETLWVCFKPEDVNDLSIVECDGCGKCVQKSPANSGDAIQDGAGVG